MTSARDIVVGLECGRASCPCHLSARKGSGVTHCLVPGHGGGRGDRNPSLLVKDGREKPLFKCLSGCSVSDVVQAFKARNLYPDSSNSVSPIPLRVPVPA